MNALSQRVTRVVGPRSARLRESCLQFVDGTGAKIVNGALNWLADRTHVEAALQSVRTRLWGEDADLLQLWYGLVRLLPSLLQLPVSTLGRCDVLGCGRSAREAQQ